MAQGEAVEAAWLIRPTLLKRKLPFPCQEAFHSTPQMVMGIGALIQGQGRRHHPAVGSPD